MTILVRDGDLEACFRCFDDDVGRWIMGKSADELEELNEKSQLGEIDVQEYENCFTSASNKAYTFKCKATKDTYNGQNRITISITEAVPFDPLAEITNSFESVKLYA
jgi:replication factor A1